MQYCNRAVKQSNITVCIITSIQSQNLVGYDFLFFSRLQNSDEVLVMSSCEFICDVLLQDFPAELFLQRPVIVKVLATLVNYYIVTISTL